MDMAWFITSTSTERMRQRRPPDLRPTLLTDLVDCDDVLTTILGTIRQTDNVESEQPDFSDDQLPTSTD